MDAYCGNVAFWKSEVSHSLKRYSMVHAFKDSLEIGVSHVDVFVDIFAFSYIMMCVDRVSYIFLCRLNPHAVSLGILCASAHGEPMFVRMEVYSLSVPFMRAIGL